MGSKVKQSPVVIWGIVAIAVGIVILLWMRMGASTDTGLDKTPPPRPGSAVAPPIPDEFIIGKGGVKGPNK